MNEAGNARVHVLSMNSVPKMKNFPEDPLVDWIRSSIWVPYGGAEDGGNRRGEIGEFKEERAK